MNLPIQSAPVRRTMPGQPTAGAVAGARPSGESIASSQHGVDASIIFGDFFDRFKISPTVPTTLPVLF
jgi:hypothetical protein